MKTFQLLLAGVAAVLLLGGCGGGGDGTASGETAQGAPPLTKKQKEDLTELQLTFESRANPEDAGVLLGDRLGYFADTGLNMYLLGPAAPSLALGYAVEETDIVMSPLPQLILAREEGLPLVAIGSVIPETTMSMIWLRGSRINGIADLKGRRIGMPDLSSQKEFLAYILSKAGLTLGDVKLEGVGYADDLVSKLERGGVDAIFGGSWNVEGAALKANGQRPVVIRATQLGVPEFDELVFVSRRGRFAKKPELLRSFLKAAYRGAAAVKEDPVAGSETVVDKSLEFVSPKEGEAGTKATAPLFSESAPIDRRRAAKLVDWMYEQGMIKNRIPVSKLIAPSTSAGTRRSP